MKKILVLTDFSKVAGNAALFSINLASYLKAGIVLFHACAYDKVLASSAGDEMKSRDDEEPELKLLELQKKFQKETKKIAGSRPSLACLCKEGEVGNLMQNTIREEKIDLVVMGCHQYSNFPDFLYGDHVKEVIANASCPVLMVPDTAKFEPLANVFYATDLRYCDINAVKFLSEICEPFKARLSLLHVCAPGLPNLPDQEGISIFRDTISNRLPASGINYSDVAPADAETLINRLIDIREMDMLAISYRKHHFFKQIFQGCFTMKRDSYTHIPLMVIPVS